MFSSLWGGSSGQEVVYPDLPTPQTKEEYLQLAKDKLKSVLEEELPKELLSLQFDDFGDRGWDGIELYDRPPEPDQPNCQGVKVIGTLPGTPKEIYEFLWDVPTRKRIEPDLLEIEIVESIDNDLDVLRTRYGAPFPVSAREFVAIRYRFANEEDNEYYIVSFSINHKAVKSDSSAVRGVLGVNALIIRPVPGKDDKTELIRIVDVEPKGNIPNFVVNMTKTSAGGFVVLLRKELLDRSSQ